jgi:site-specific recombinase XerD
MAGSSPPPTITIRTVRAQMATKEQSSKLTLEYRGGKIQFGLHKPTDQYRKKHKGKTLYLGSSPDGVLDQWLEKTSQHDDELVNTIAQQPIEEMTVERLCNQVLACKELDVDSGELTRTTFDLYVRYGKWIADFFGRQTLVSDLTPADFVRFKADLAKPKATRKNGRVIKKAAKRKLSLVGLATKMRHVRMFFNFALAEEWIDKLPWGAKTFQLPTKKAIKKARSRKRDKTASRQEILKLLESADDTWKAMLLVAINSGSGNTDVAMMTHSDIEEDGWVEQARNKTGEYRRFKLWPETLEAISKLPKHEDGLIFHSKQGSKLIPAGTHNPITKGFSNLVSKAGIKRENLSFYSLRHTFQTVADENVDLVATQVIMGHSRNSISDNYRGKISDARLEAVTDHVRRWLFDLDDNK